VGKTTLVLQFVDGTFDPRYVSTIGVDFKIKQASVNGLNVKLQIWDTAGAERFRSLIMSYFRGANGVIFVFDVTKPDTFEEIKSTYSNMIELGHISEDTPCALIANKTDLGPRAVSTEEIAKWCDDHGHMPFFETSATDHGSVTSAFEGFTQVILGRENDNPQ